MAVARPSDSPRPASSPAAHRVSIGSWAFAFGPYERDPWSFERVCEFAASAGYDGVEINGFRPHPHFDDFPAGAGTTELGEQIQGHGLGISGYAPDFRHVPPPKVATEIYLAEIDKARDFCDRLDIRTLRVDTALPPQEMSPEDYEHCFHQLVKSWSLAAERCHSSDVTLVWEFEPGFWLNRPSEIERVLTSVAHPNFGLLFDSSHAYTGGVRGARQGPTPESVASLEAFANRFFSFIKHLHLADSDGSLHDEDTSAHTPLGKGLVDFPSLLRVLAPIADRLPWWCVDLCYCEDADLKATEALAYVRGLEREASL
jgi:sugar phosphate isomerase/epimerase